MNWSGIFILLGIMFTMFVILPWFAMVIRDLIKTFWDENNRFD
jgi:hypothetical protein